MNKAYIIVGLLFSTVSVQAQTSKNPQISKAVNNYQLTKYTFSSGGGLMTGGVYKVTGAIGQIDAGHNSTNGSYTFTGGFLGSTTAINLGDNIFKNSFEN